MDTQQTTTPPKRKPEKSPLAFRIFVRVFIFFIILFILLISAGFIIGIYYQDDVKQFVITEINKQLINQIIVEPKDIDFTVLKKFPDASIDFKKIKISEVSDKVKKDTLFQAGEISLHFNILDIFNKNYKIKKIEIDNASLKIKIDKHGKDNFHFWKSSTDTTSANKNLSFDLEKIILKNVHFSFKDNKTKIEALGLVRNTTFSGNFSEKHYSLETASDILIHTFKVNEQSYLNNKNISAQIILDVDKEIPSYKIKEGNIKIEKLLFQIVGNVIAANNEPILNIDVRGKDMNIKSLLSLIPEKYKAKINNYQSNGEFYFNTTLRGSFATNQTPKIVADFGVNNADITEVKDNIVLHNATLKGHYNNGNKNDKVTSSLSLKSFSATIKEGNIAGEITLNNLENPSFDGNIKADLSLDELQKFLKIDTIETMTGQLKMDAEFKGDGKNIENGKWDNVTTTGSLTITNMNMKLKNNTLPFANINGDFKFDNNDLTVNSFTGTAGSSDFALKGALRNVVGFILKDKENITIETSFNSKNLNLDELLGNKDKTKNSESKYKLKFSEHINVTLNSQIQHLVFRKFDATNIQGVIKMKDKKLYADSIILSTMDGTITTSGLVDASDSTKILVTCFSNLDSINITKLFYSFENFGSTTVTDKNLKGITSLKIQFASELSPDLKINTDKLYAGINMTIVNGELNNVEALKSLSRFISLNDLENIHFATLKNQIEIKNKMVTIPKMEINSNAINLVVAGKHTFDNKIDYLVELSLNELLTKKARKNKKENEDFGVVEDDGLGRTHIYLSMTGTVDHPIIKYDTKGGMQKIKQDIKVEKKELKEVLKKEFGMFKKDSTLTSKPLKTKEDKFKIKWDEVDKKEEKKELKLPKKKEEDDF